MVLTAQGSLMHPWIARRLVYPLQERALHRPTFGMLVGLESSQWLPRAEIEGIQARKLNALLQVALAHSPWHADRLRAAGLADEAQRGRVTLADLPRLPTMSKPDARSQLERIVWRDVPGGAFRYNTGGSSGEPLIFYYGRDRQASDAAGRMRARRWWGVEVGDREVYLWGAPVELSKTDRIRTLRDRLINQLVLNAFEMSPAQMDDYLDAIAAWRPRCVYGYASSVALLAAHADAKGRRLRLPELRVVCTTGEPLYPHQRALIEKVFGARSANEFGSRDIGFTAHETPEGQMLLLSENVILEVLDAEGNPVPTGETGEAVMTALTSLAQPFIRYRTGDMVRLSREACRRKTGLHVIDEIIGRQTDFIVRSDGTIMHALAVIYVLRSVEGVEQFKCIQLAPNVVQVLIVPGPRWGDASRQAVVAGLQARLGVDLEVDVTLQPSIPVEASGKHRYVVSHVPLTAELQRAAA
jgi:phenylacetate-CoA ligase